MARKTGREYAAQVRALRASGLSFPASNGYRLADAANWTRGQKAAVTRAANRYTQTEEQTDTPTRGRARQRIAPDYIDEPQGRERGDFRDVEYDDTGDDFEDSFAEQFFEDAAGDEREEYSDIDWLDFDEADDLTDYYDDDYKEI